MTGFSLQTPIDARLLPAGPNRSKARVTGTSQLFVGIDIPPWDTERHLVLFTIDRRKKPPSPPAVLSRLLVIDDKPAWENRRRFMWAHDERGHNWTQKFVNPDAISTKDPHRLGLLTQARKGLKQLGFDPRIVDATFPDLSWAAEKH